MGNVKINFLNSNGEDFLLAKQGEVLPLQQRASAQLAPYRSYLSFGDVNVYTQRSQFVLISNTGNRPLRIQNIQSMNSVFQVSDQNFVIPPGEARNLRITFNPYFAQNYSSYITFATNDPTQPSASIFVSGRGLAQ